MEKGEVSKSMPWMAALAAVAGVVILMGAAGADGGPMVGIIGLVLTVAGGVRFVTGMIDYAKG